MGSKMPDFVTKNQHTFVVELYNYLEQAIFTRIEVSVFQNQNCDLVCHFPGLAFSSPVIWSVIFRSCIFQSLIFFGPSFSGPANSAPPHLRVAVLVTIILANVNQF